MLVLRSAIAGGRKGGFSAAFGVSLGVLSWGLVSALGVSAVVAVSSSAFEVLKLVGAAYLVWLGAIILWRNRRLAAASDSREVMRPSLRGTQAFRNGLLTNLLNPKVGVFYMTLLPQFIPNGAPALPLSLLLAGIHVLEGLAWFSSIILLVSRAQHLIARDTLRQRLQQISGAVFVGFGFRLALDRL